MLASKIKDAALVESGSQRKDPYYLVRKEEIVKAPNMGLLNPSATSLQKGISFRKYDKSGAYHEGESTSIFTRRNNS